MTGLPEGIYHAGLAALVKRFGHTPDSMEQVMIVADAVLPLIAAGERERIAAQIEAYAANYPEDVFPPGSDSRDAIGGTAMRHAYSNAARMIREESTP
jgi:hypothetical protein